MKARKYTVSEIQEKIASALSPDNAMFQKLEQLGVKELVEELSIYQQELEYQNDELRYAQVAMEKAKLYAEDLFETAPVAYVVLGEDFGIVRFNALFKATFAHTTFEVLKDVDFRRLIAADDQDDFHRFMLDDEKGRYKNGLTLKIGKRFFHLRAQLRILDNQHEWRLSLTDVHNEQLILRSLASSERRFKNLINLVPGVIFTLKGDTKQITFVSNQVETYLGIPAADIVGTNLGRYVLDADQQKIEEFQKDLDDPNNHPSPHSVEVRFVDQAGSPCWTEILAISVHDPDVNKSYFLCLAHPIQSLKEQQFDLEAKNDRLQQFSHIVSHNLKAYVSNVHGLVGLLAEKDNTPDERDELVLMLQKSSKNLMEAIQHLNEMLKIQKNGGLGKEKLLLKSELQKVIGALEPELAAVGLLVELDLPENTLVCFHPAYLQSILLNMCTNAIRYKRNIPHARLQIQAREESDSTIQLVFEDNGQGMDLSVVGQKLFGMFQTFHNHAEAKGLGLFMVKHQLEAMGGRVEVRSKVGEGTRFELYIPGCLDGATETE